MNAGARRWCFADQTDLDDVVEQQRRLGQGAS